MKLSHDFYGQSALDIAPLLMGKLLCRQTENGIIKLRITETEAYFGEDDTACHAHKGRTNRTEIMYANGGFAYIYLCYGIHHLLNIVTGRKDFPEAVLIRGLEGFNGPGKLTKALKIDMTLNKENLITSDKLWLEDDGFSYQYDLSKRIGINYADEEDINKLWRFTAKTKAAKP